MAERAMSVSAMTAPAIAARVMSVLAMSALLAAAVLPFGAYAEEPVKAGANVTGKPVIGPYTAQPSEEEVRLEDNLLEWDEIDGLIHKYNATVVKNRNEFSIDNRRTYNAQQLSNYLYDEASELEVLANSCDDTSAMLAATYRGQAEALRLQADNNVTDHEVLLLQYDLIEKQTDAAARKLFLEYYTSLFEKDYAENNIAYLERAYHSAANRQGVGMATEIEVLTAKESMENAKAGLLTTETAGANARSNLLVICGWDYGSDGQIGPLPEIDPATAAAVDYENDFAAAKEKNITLKIDELKLKNVQERDLSSVVNEQNRNQLENDKDSFGINFKAAYDALVNAVTAYQNAVNDCAVADQNLEAAERQFILGTISSVELEKSRNAQKAAELAKHKAYIALLSARSVYDDAVSGNV